MSIFVGGFSLPVLWLSYPCRHRAFDLLRFSFPSSLKKGQLLTTSSGLMLELTAMCLASALSSCVLEYELSYMGLHNAVHPSVPVF